jgi:hypothetical protein
LPIASEEESTVAKTSEPSLNLPGISMDTSTDSIVLSPSETLTPLMGTSPGVQHLPVFAGTPVPWPREVISAENAVDVVELARWGKGTIHGLAWSPDGNALAVASSIGIYLYAAQTLEGN